jgi:hypothetical protein
MKSYNTPISFDKQQEWQPLTSPEVDALFRIQVADGGHFAAQCLRPVARLLR